MGIPSGVYLVRASVPGAFYAQEYYTDSIYWETATGVEVNAQENKTNIDFSLVTGGTISGRVFDDGVTPQAIPNVVVHAFELASRRVIQPGCQTNSSGEYTTPMLPPGNFGVWVNTIETGYVRETYDNIIGSSQPNGTPILVSASNNTENINFSLALGGTISGTVRDQTGQLLGNISVNASPPDGSPVGFGALTDNNGNYTITGIPYGDYKVNAPCGWGSNDINYAMQFYNGKTWDNADIVNLSAASPNISGIEFNLEKVSPGSTISGYIYDATNQTPNTPLEGATVMLWTATTAELVMDTITASDGSYTFTNINDGSYKVMAVKSGYAQKFWENSLSWTNATSIPISSTQGADHIDLSLGAGGHIQGVVIEKNTNLPIPGVTVFIQSADALGDASKSLSLLTGESGVYETYIPYGNYIVFSPAGLNQQDSLYLRLYFNNVVNLGNAEIIEISTASGRTDINFNLEKVADSGSISGIIVDENGTPITDCHVFAEHFDNAQWAAGAFTDSQGNYTLLGLPPGNYRVIACPSNNGLTYANEYFNNTYHRNQAQAVGVTAGNTTFEINFVLSPGSSMHGRVTNTNGEPLAGVSVNASPANDNSVGFGDETDIQGYYSISNIPYGDYTIIAPCGWAANDSRYVPEYYDNQLNYNEANILTIPPEKEINFVLEEGGSISGVITDQQTGQVPQDTANGSLSLSQGWHKFVYRQEEIAGSQVSKAAFKSPNDTEWQWFSTSNLSIKTSLEQNAQSGIVLTTKKNTWTKNPFTHSELVQCIDQDALAETGWFGQSIVDTVNQLENIHGNDDNYTSYFEAYFYVDEAGSWSFSTDSDDASEIVIDDQVVASWYQGHGAMGRWEHKGRISIYVLNNGEWLNNEQGFNSDGSYLTKALLPGNYYIQARVPGYYDLFWQGKIVFNEADPISVSAGSQTSNINFGLKSQGAFVEAPRLVSHDPTGILRLGGGVQANYFQFYFNHEMAPASFSPADDIVSFTGPSGSLSITSYIWIDSRTLFVMFEPQYTAGTYRMVIGSQIIDTSGNALDQDGDLISGENLDDRYIASFSLSAPRLFSSTPSGKAAPPVSAIQFNFDRPMDRTSFSITDDIVSFTGPSGNTMVTGYNWISSYTLEISFAPQIANGEYKMVMGPRILDEYGNPLDQDEDQIVGENNDDQYVASFLLAYTGIISYNTNWGPENGVILVNGIVTISDGVTLSVQPGTIIKFFDSNSGIYVFGVMNIYGSTETPVILTSWRDDTAGGDTNSDGTTTIPAAGDWWAVNFYNPTNPSNLENIDIRYSSMGISSYPASQFSPGHVKVIDSIFQHNAVALEANTPYGLLEVENSLIINNLNALQAGSTGGITLTNCTVVGNDSAGELAAVILDVVNSIFAFNGRFTHPPYQNAPDIEAKNSIFYQTGESAIKGWVGDQIFRDNKNLTADPLFVNRDDGFYELSAGSPAIDAGTGIGASPDDILGQLRFDDQGMPNLGSGFPAYVDIGAFERQQDTASPDLELTYVSDPIPEFVNAGDSFNVRWTVSNVGLEDCIGTWTDNIFLSTDPYLSSNDHLLEQRAHSSTLVAGDSYTEELTATAPAVSGPFYLLVETNAQDSIPDPVKTNNFAVASRVLAIGVPVLSIGTPISGTIVNHEWTYLRFEAAAGNTVLMNLDAAVQSGATGLYVRYGDLPTLNEYDAAGRVPNAPDQQLRIPSTIDGTYYVGIYGSYIPYNLTGYTIKAELTSLDVRVVSPNVVGNGGQATVKIEGDQFSDNAQVQLVASDGKTIGGIERYQDATVIFATFDLAAAGAAPGTYDVAVTLGSNVATLTGSVRVISSGEADFHASLSMPGTARPNRVITIYVNYSNTGTNDLYSPLLTLTGPEECSYQLPGSEDWLPGPTLKLMALSTNMPVNILRAGQSETIELKIHTPFNPGTLSISLNSLGAKPGDGSDQSINWSNWYSDGTVISDMETKLGRTWNEYITVLGKTAVASAPWEGLRYLASDLEYLALLGFDEQLSIQINSSNNDTESLTPQEYTRDPKIILDLWNGNSWVAANRDNIEPNSKVAIIVHGWRSSPNNPEFANMARALAATGDFNQVLAIDWSAYANTWLINPFSPTFYISRVANEITSELLDLRINTQVSHIIGHSHGAHIAGLIGNNFGGMIGRITALDPSEESVHTYITSPNWGGKQWGPQSAIFVDSYKSSILAGGEYPWGQDNFLLVENGYTWNGKDVAGRHGFAIYWYIQTILNRGTNDFGLGYDWGKDSWNNAKSKISNYSGIEGPWKGLIRGPFTGSTNSSVLECFSESTDFGTYTNTWFYPGAWLGSGSEAVKSVIYDLSNAVEMKVTNLEAISEDGSDTWKAGGKGTLVYDIENHADNQSIPKNYRYDAQMGRAIGFLGRPGFGPIRDKFYLSIDDQLDVNIDLPLGSLEHDEKHFLGSRTESDSIKRFDKPLNLPGKKEILAMGGGSEFLDTYYIFADAGSTKTTSELFVGELYPANNLGIIPIHIEGEDLSANAGSDQKLSDTDGDGVVMVTLDGSLSAPEDRIKSYDWSVGVSGKIVDRAFSIGQNLVTLTITDKDTGEFDVDVVVINIEPKKELPKGPGIGGGTTVIQTSYSPEDKWGSAGYDSPETVTGNEKHYILPDGEISYRIEMWNKPEAPVPTQDATIYDILDPNIFDLSTFNFTRVGFLKWDQPLSGGQSIDTRIDTRPEMNIAVDVKASLDPETGRIDWWFHTVDPLTGEYPEDPNAGFLPPYNPETGFEIGWMEYTVKLKPDLASGTTIANQAFVQFDFLGPWGPAPKEGPWVNTIDSKVPVSQINPLPEITNELSFKVSWTGADEPEGSGIASFDIFVSDNGDPYYLWLDDTILTEQIFTGQYGHSYSFYSLARDHVGNIQDMSSITYAITSLVLAGSLNASFTAVPLSGDEPLPVSFTDLSTPSQDIVSWSWDFGDGQISIEQNPTHSFIDNGTFNVTLTIGDANGSTAQYSLNITVDNVSPVVDDGADQTIPWGNTLSLLGSFSDPGADTWTATVDYGDGTGVQTLDTEGKTFTLSHAYTKENIGDKTVKVTVKDDDGGIGTDTLIVHVEKHSVTLAVTANPVAVPVHAAGGDSSSFQITAKINGTLSDLALISKEKLKIRFNPVGGGSPSPEISAISFNSSMGTAIFTIPESFLTVETYTLTIRLENVYVEAVSIEDVLVVYDASLGFATGGGWFIWPEGTGDPKLTGTKTNFGFTMKYNNKGQQVQGSLLVIAHLKDGSIYRLKSNALNGLALSPVSNSIGWASFSGKCTYMWPDNPDVYETVGGKEFFVYVEDGNNPGINPDKFWFTVIGQPFSLDKDQGKDADSGERMDLGGGNIVIPHTLGK